MSIQIEFIKSQLNYPIEIYKQHDYSTKDLNTQIVKLQTSNLIVIGDLHGNIKKAIEILILAQVIDFEIEQLKVFINVWNRGMFEDKETILSLKNLIKIIKVKSLKQVIFLGDILADRVGNDILGLAFINHLRAVGLQIETLIGNHDHACNFIDHSAANFMGNYVSSFYAGFNIYNSYDKDQKLEVDNLFNSFIQNSKLLIFDSNSKILFVHAGIRERNLKIFVKLLKSLKILTYDLVLSSSNFPQICDLINRFYSDYRSKDMYSDKRYVIENKILKYLHDGNRREFEGFLWVGEHNYTTDNKFFTNLGVKTIVHGHDSFDQESIFCPKNINYNMNSKFTVINLDNNQGKKIDESSEPLPLYLG